ncbi:MAG: hypothetical protein WBV61_10995 [Rhodanobacteraceae bacterium]
MNALAGFAIKGRRVRVRTGFGAGISVALACFALPAVATDFPVSGSLSLNGTVSALPDGGVFAGSAYDPSSGQIAPGAFVFPQATLSFDTPFGTAVATYLVSQDNTSAGMVEADGNASLTDTDLQLDVLSLEISGFPVALGNCTFAPIVLALDGGGSMDGLALGDNGFSVPPVAADDCGGYGAEIDDQIAGSNNDIALELAGDFTPPSGDEIFGNGFDPP